MKISAEFKLNLKIPEVKKKTKEAVRLALRDTIVDIHRDALIESPRKTGHNRRSMASEVSGMGVVKLGEDAKYSKVVDDNKLEAACYSTSGYGGFLETGTYKMAARPYMKPAADKNYTLEKISNKIKGYLK